MLLASLRRLPGAGLCPGRVGSNNSELGPPHAGRPRSVATQMGRNDGASGGSRSRPMKKRRWYSEEGGLEATDASEPGPSGRQAPERPAAPSGLSGGSRWESREGGREGGRRGSRRVNEEEEEEQDSRGWWQRPEERSLQAYAPPALQAWQEERLQLAYAMGRRKAQIQELARELDLDRSVVIGWLKEFSLRPQGERDTILAARKAEAEERRAEEASRAAVEAATGQGRGESLAAAAAARQQEQQGQEPTGFVPYYLRKQLGVSKHKRISGEALRTLESVYDRTPYPSADVVKGLFELHRLQREAALAWFAARREADGITSSTQKRVGRTNREKDRNLDGAFTEERSVLDDEADQAAARQWQARRPAVEPAGDRALGAQAGDTAAARPQQQQQQPREPEPVVVTMSKREMAQLRSSLPSPNKYKGRQMAEQGVKTSAADPVTQIGNVKFVEDPTEAKDKIRRLWRYKAATAPASGGRLKLKVAPREGAPDDGGAAQ